MFDLDSSRMTPYPDLFSCSSVYVSLVGTLQFTPRTLQVGYSRSTSSREVAVGGQPSQSCAHTPWSRSRGPTVGRGFGAVIGTSATSNVGGDFVALAGTHQTGGRRGEAPRRSPIRGMHARSSFRLAPRSSPRPAPDHRRRNVDSVKRMQDQCDKH